MTANRLLVRRRRFLGGAAAVALAAAALGAGRLLAPTALRRKIRKALPGLALEDRVLDQFVEDHLRHRDEVADPSMPEHLRLLCSTDFFQRGADESRPPRYVGYYDPYLRLCDNPLGGG